MLKNREGKTVTVDEMTKEVLAQMAERPVNRRVLEDAVRRIAWAVFLATSPQRPLAGAMVNDADEMLACYDKKWGG